MAALAVFLLASGVLGQSAAPTAPRFEAATIRTSTVSMGPRGSRTRIDPSHFEMLGESLPQLIRRAYRLEPYQTVTGPDWMRRAYFDVYATLPEGVSKNLIPEMLQALLADQMKLVLRRESREEPVCILSVGKGGPKLKEVPADLKPDMAIPHKDNRTAVLRMKGTDGYLTYSKLNGTVILDATKIGMPELALALRTELNVPVLDRTGLQGFYEISLFVPGTVLTSRPGRGAAAQTPGAAPIDDSEILLAASDPEGVNLFKTIQRIGLKLQKSKAPIEHLVVESAEQRPGEK